MVCFKGRKPKMKKQRIHVLVLFLFTVLFITAASHADEIELSYRLKWLFNTSVAGDIYADATPKSECPSSSSLMAFFSGLPSLTLPFSPASLKYPLASA